ncbi:MAG: HTH-type transcriptional activator RhaS [Lentisphaerae bacterium ADurb.Bin082]|nr:MAG: HTH-type transcriptional activator RhaS [Lentisphaerae bacterium ADurb.Bin082]
MPIQARILADCVFCMSGCAGMSIKTEKKASEQTQAILWLESLPRKLQMIPHLRTLAYHPDFRLINESKSSSFQFCFRRSANCDSRLAIRINGVLHWVDFPHIMIKKPGQSIEFLNADRADALYFSYPPEAATFFLMNAMPQVFSLAEFPLSERVDALIQLVAESSSRLGELGVADRLDLDCYILVHESFLQTVEYNIPQSDYEKKIRKIASYLQTHFTEKIDFSQLAKKHGFSYRSMLRHWALVFDQTPAAYLANLKIFEAKRLLKETKLSIAEIAFRVGCCDDGYFCRLFRRHTGMSPRKFRLQ